MMNDDSSHQALLGLTARIVAAHVGHHAMPGADLPGLISGVFSTLRTAGGAEPEREVLAPAVPIKKSVHADFLVCLEDGRKLKMLKRHLAVRYGMTPDDYRRRWGLGDSYPMVAPAYAEQRSQLAKQVGLGRKRVIEAPPAEPKPAAPEPKRKARGRRKAA